MKQNHKSKRTKYHEPQSVNRAFPALPEVCGLEKKCFAMSSKLLDNSFSAVSTGWGGLALQRLGAKEVGSLGLDKWVSHHDCNICVNLSGSHSFLSACTAIQEHICNRRFAFVDLRVEIFDTHIGQLAVRHSPTCGRDWFSVCYFDKCASSACVRKIVCERESHDRNE